MRTHHSTPLSGSRLGHLASHALVIGLLAGAVALAGWQRLAGKAQRAGITGDEGLSLLAATCHEGAFRRALNGSAPYGRWVASREWQHFVKPERFFCFGLISRDLAAVDFHPPLYFWILHVWLFATGLRLWTLVILNLIFALGVIAGLFVLARRLFGSNLSGAVLGFIWAASPLPVAAGIEGRPYELLALCVVGFFAQLVVVCARGQTPTLGRLAWLAAWAGVGLLTHYMFLIALLGGAVFAASRVVTMGAKRSLRVAAAVVLGLCLALLFHPIAWHIAHKSRSSTVASDSKPFLLLKAKANANQWRFVEQTTAGFARGGTGAMAGLVLLGVGAAFVVARHRKPLAAWRPQTAGAEILLAVATVVVAITYFYASGRLPRHAMDAKYLSVVWPLLSIVPVVIARVLAPLQNILQIAVVWLFAVAAWQDMPGKTDLRVLNMPIASQDAQPPLVVHTGSWHPVVAWIARRNDASKFFIDSPTDAASTLYGEWLQLVDQGQTVEMEIPEVFARPLLRRLTHDHYGVRRVGRIIRKDFGRFMISPRPQRRH